MLSNSLAKEKKQSYEVKFKLSAFEKLLEQGIYGLFEDLRLYTYLLSHMFRKTPQLMMDVTKRRFRCVGQAIRQG
jgi:hypothetical protein